LREEDASHLTLAREQGHRVKNAVAVVEAVVQQSLRDQPERGRTINRRIRAGLAQIELEGQDVSQPGDLRDLLTAELEPFDLERFTFEGGGVAQLPPKIRTILSLVVHELATNALKYGALSVPEGRVKVTWERHGACARIIWVETGGPPVQAPSKRGYGSILLQRLVQSVGGSFVMDFRPTGLTVEISAVLA
jgi:two-component sensor histidine kinase